MADVPFLTARNPRALAEIVLGGPIDWSTVADPRSFLEDVLQTPYEQLFDPRHDSPVYLGFALDEQGDMVPSDPSFVGHDDPGGSDLERYPAIDLEHIRHLGDLKELMGASPEELPVRRLVPGRAGGWTIEVGQAAASRATTLARVFPENVLARIWDHLKIDLGWTPPNGQWVDGGRFFDEAAEFFDPVQGGLGDCWLIAAMSSVAWALPYTVSQRSRATGTSNDQFTNLFEFYDPADGSKHSFEATDETVMWSGTTSAMFGHSSEAGEIWPALVEKAYAMWRGNTTNDHPNLTVLNGGDPVAASAALTNRKPHYTGTNGTSTTDLINLVKAHSSNHRTIDPMTAWTYNSGDDAPDHVDYNDANLVACHAYSVLGWVRGSQLRWHSAFDLERAKLFAAALERPATKEAVGAAARFDTHLEDLELNFEWRLAQDYIVLRNPWGYHEATLGELHGVISMRDVSFWRSIDLNVDDGTFAIDVPTFKRYFAGIGVAL